MLNIYKKEKDIPPNMKLVKINDIFFNRHTSHMLDKQASDVIYKIDGSELKGRYQIISYLNGDVINVDKLSSGCKTALNLMYNPDTVFSLKECGDNALRVIYEKNTGNAYSEYPVISINMTSVLVHDRFGEQEIASYEALMGWWEDV